MSEITRLKYFVDGKWIESLTTQNVDRYNPMNMDAVLPISSEPDHKVTIDPISEYQKWYIGMKMLVRQAEYAKENGQWKESQDLLIKVDRMTSEFADKRLSR